MSDIHLGGISPGDDSRTRVRRADREIKDEFEIASILHRARVGFIATAQSDQPYLNSNLFWFDEAQKRIYFHTAISGRTRDNIEANPRVCFGIAEMGELLPADTAIEFSTEYTGVIAFGQARIVEEPAEAEHGLNGLLKKYFPDLKPGEDFHVITSEELAVTSVFAIDIESWSGKQKKKSV